MMRLSASAATRCTSGRIVNTTVPVASVPLNSPPIARAVSSSPDAYVYLAESIRAWPTQEQLAGRIEAASIGQ